MIIATVIPAGVITTEVTQKSGEQELVITVDSFTTASIPAFQIATEESQLRGPPGKDGNGSNTLIWEQNTPLISWTVPHNTGRYPSVTVVDTLGFKVESDVAYIDQNIVQITHGTAFAGKAYIN